MKAKHVCLDCLYAEWKKQLLYHSDFTPIQKEVFVEELWCTKNNQKVNPLQPACKHFKPRRRPKRIRVVVELSEDLASSLKERYRTDDICEIVKQLLNQDGLEVKRLEEVADLMIKTNEDIPLCPATSSQVNAIMRVLGEGGSVLYNVFIDKENYKVWVRSPCAIVECVIGGEGELKLKKRLKYELDRLLREWL